MEILGIGLPELAFILVIALILLGPKDMVAAGRTFGKTLRKIVTSPTWKAVRTTGQELQQLPTRLMREAGLEDDFKDIEREIRGATQVNIDPRLSTHSFEDEQAPDPSDAGASHTEQDSGFEAPPEDPRD